MGTTSINQAEKINVRGIDFFNVTLNEAFSIAESFIESPDKLTNVIYTPNSEIVQECIDDKQNADGNLFTILNSASMVIPDGAGVVLASKILGTPLKQKVAGIDLAYKLIDYLADTGRTLFLLGAKPEVVEKAADNLLKKYKNLKVFYNHGFFDKENPEENQKVLDKINASEADAIFVCFGAPASERWIFNNKSKINKGLLIGLGGTIDTISGMANKRAPEIFIKLNLEWFYRLMKEPSRMDRMKRIPKFIFGTCFARFKK